MNVSSKLNTSVRITACIESDLSKIISQYRSNKIFIVTEKNVDEQCLPILNAIPEFKNIKKLVISLGEENKSLSSVEKIWLFLSRSGADRKSLIVNVGGGALTDIGSFAASTFKRGTDFVNVPTTLLAQVDASIGGKTGFNFNGLKNEIGVINQPRQVLIDTRFLKTISKDEFVSGYAEMVKHGLIYSEEHLEELVGFGLDSPDWKILLKIISHSIDIKEHFVSRDPNENNIRKALNFGHTIGHAFESYALKQKCHILHGFAVAYGMIAELYISHKMCDFPLVELNRLSNWLISIYGRFEIQPSDYDCLFQLMLHDKKNEGERINFTLISRVGEVKINQACSKEIIFNSLEYYRTL